MKDQYRTVLNAGIDEFVVKRSRFIGATLPITTAQQAQEFIEEKKKEHWNATHNVYAYSVRKTGEVRCSDDGEPQGTAGVPTLDILQKENVTDCVVVATRFYGGIQLGTGGLVRAYSKTAKMALASGTIVTMYLCTCAKLVCDYQFYGIAEHVLAEIGAKTVDTFFLEDVTIDFYVSSKEFDLLDARIRQASSGQYQVDAYGTKYEALDVSEKR